MGKCVSIIISVNEGMSDSESGMKWYWHISSEQMKRMKTNFRMMSIVADEVYTNEYNQVTPTDQAYTNTHTYTHSQTRTHSNSKQTRRSDISLFGERFYLLAQFFFDIIIIRKTCTNCWGCHCDIVSVGGGSRGGFDGGSSGDIAVCCCCFNCQTRWSQKAWKLTLLQREHFVWFFFVFVGPLSFGWNFGNFDSVRWLPIDFTVLINSVKRFIPPLESRFSPRFFTSGLIDRSWPCEIMYPKKKIKGRKNKVKYENLGTTMWKKGFIY